MSRIVKWRELNKNIYKQKEGENLTYTPIIVSAVVKAIQDFPLINISFDGTNIIKKKAINIGIATALPNGNLIVPVVKNADQLSLIELSRQINQLIFKARHNKLQPRDITEGTYTISNIGTFGNLIGTPIINQPQVAILAVGAIKKKPAVIETPEGDYIGIRQKMFLSHSYDHRIIDGMLGGSFVQKVAQYLEDFNDKQEIIY
jgi:2-oxoglutarate dehydrogenase E2 component (dihydrolipoamide succinyltransferase)